METQKTTLRILRGAAGTELHWTEFEVAAAGKTVLDALKEIHDGQDRTLAFRAQCRSGICGSCAMRINGQASLACKTFLSRVAQEGVVQIEPLLNLPVIRDLAVEENAFWQEIERIKPWIVEGGQAGTDHQTVVNIPGDICSSNLDLDKTGECILCAACYSDCEVQTIKPQGYVGPAGFVQMHRYARDFRDHGSRERARILEKQGIWSCTHMFNCTQTCPKNIPVGDAIGQLRACLLATGQGHNAGGRHVRSFVYAVKHTGRLNEFWALIKTRGLQVVADLPTGLRMAIRGKIPWPWARQSKNRQEVKRFFD